MLLLSNDWVHRGCQPCQITAANTECLKINSDSKESYFCVTYGYNEKHSFSCKVTRWLESIHSNEASLCQTGFPLALWTWLPSFSVDDTRKFKLDKHPSFPLIWRMVVMHQLSIFSKNLFSVVLNSSLVSGQKFSLHITCPHRLPQTSCLYWCLNPRDKYVCKYPLFLKNRFPSYKYKPKRGVLV